MHHDSPAGRTTCAPHALDPQSSALPGCATPRTEAVSSAVLLGAQEPAAAANDGLLRHLTPAAERDLRRAETELLGSGIAYAVHASPWRWCGPRAGELVGALTFRRWLPDGRTFDLACHITLDPERRGVAHTHVVVRSTHEVRLLSGQPPVEQWWAPVSVLRSAETDAIAYEARAAWDDPPPRVTFDAHDAGTVALVLEAGSLGTLRGELRLVASLGLAYVVPTHPGVLTDEAAVLALRRAVLDGRLAVPGWIRAALDRGLTLLAVKGGAL